MARVVSYLHPLFRSAVNRPHDSVSRMMRRRPRGEGKKIWANAALGRLLLG